MADNASIYKNTSTGLITVKTSRGSNEVEQVLSADMEGYKAAEAALALAEAIPNPLGETKEALAKEKTLRAKAEAEAKDLVERLKASARKIALLLTGTSDTIAPGLIKEYPEWQVGLSVDAGDAYRIGDILYLSKRPHVTSDENGPKSANAKDYWKGGAIPEDEVPEPKPGVKYPKGTVVAYQGVDYYATVDTNEGPEVGYPTWDLLSNKPKD